MFFTIGIIIGIVIGWVANEKWDWIKDKSCILEKISYVRN